MCNGKPRLIIKRYEKKEGWGKCVKLAAIKEEAKAKNGCRDLKHNYIAGAPSFFDVPSNF